MSFTQGGIYLTKLNPAKGKEVGKLRPSIILTDQLILDTNPDVVFVCPLSSASTTEYHFAHAPITKRGLINSDSFALIEHMRSISVDRLHRTLLGQVTLEEFTDILIKLNVQISPAHAFGHNCSTIHEPTTVYGTE